MRGGRPPRWRVPALALVLVVVLTGCHVELQVGLDVRRDGSGQVEVSAALDGAALERAPDLADQLEVADLVEAGWTVTGPAPEADGRTWIRAVKPFESVEGAGAVLREVSGPDGPFRDFEVRRDPTLVRDEWHFTGTADLSEGLAAFSDDALRERLDGTNVGLPDEEVAAVAGRPLEEALTFEVEVGLPGDVSSNGRVEGHRAVWRPALGESVALSATGARPNTAALLWLSVAVAAAVALVALLVVRWRRGRGRPTRAAPSTT